MRHVRLSSRLPADLAPNPLARLLAEKRSAGVPILDLTESNPTRAGIAYPEGLLDALADPRGLVYEPDPRGLPEARRAVAGYYAERGRRVEPERILLTASTSEAYSFLFKVLADPGAAVLVPAPSYPLFDHLAALEAVRTVSYPLVHDGRWSIDLPSLERAAEGEDVRALVLVSPNNPTGSFLRSEDLPAVLAFCSRAGCALLADEVFSDYPIQPAAGSVPTLAGEPSGEVPVFILSGLSKVCGLPQVKLAWIVADAGPDLRAGLDLVADTYLSVGTPVQHALPKLLAARGPVQARIAARLRANLTALRGACRSRPAARILEPEGGWYAVLQVPRILSEEELVRRLLDEEHVLVHPGYYYDFPEEAYLVLGLLTPPEIFAAGIERVFRIVAGE